MITQPLPCDQCEYTAKRQYNLRIPKESHHEGILYSCEHCNFEAKSASIFKRDLLQMRKNWKRGRFYVSRLYFSRLYDILSLQFINVNHKRETKMLVFSTSLELYKPMFTIYSLFGQ